MKKLTILLLLLCSVSLSAQQRPIAATTVQTTDTTANSVLVGCVIGSTTCTGGIKAGAAAFSGLFTDTALGTHTFTAAGVGANLLKVANTAVGTGNSAGFWLLNDEAVTSAGGLVQTSSTYNTAAANAYDPVNTASATQLVAARGGGMVLVAPNGSLKVYIGSATTQRWGINTAGDLTVGASAKIMDSVGTPTISWTAGSSVVGTDYAFLVGAPTVASAIGGVTFGHTWTTAPVCTITTSSTSLVVAIGNTTTTSVTWTTSPAAGSPDKLYVLCRSY